MTRTTSGSRLGGNGGGGGDLFGGTGSSGDSLKKNGNHLALRGLHHYSTLVGVVGGGRRVFAHRARYAILDVRTLQDFGLDDVVTSSAIMEDHTQASISHFHIPTTDCPYKTDIYFYNHPGVPGAAQGDGTAFPNHQFPPPCFISQLVTVVHTSRYTRLTLSFYRISTTSGQLGLI